jgi:protoporphyrinogen oxidase
VAKYDVAIIGGGMGGCIAAALLSKLGKKVILLEQGPELSGRAMDFPYKDGYTLELGGHLIVDDGSGISRICEYLGRPFEIGSDNDCLPFWKEDQWHYIEDLYNIDKSEIKKIIKEIVNTDFEEFDKYDNIPVRTWLKARTDNEGIITLYETLSGLEFQTSDWWDNSASEFLWMRKCHYMNKQTAAYSYWPKGGPVKIIESLIDLIKSNGGEVRTNARTLEIVVDNYKVRGVKIQAPKLTPNEYPEPEMIEADNVLSTVSIWSVMDIIPENILPNWYESKIKVLAQDIFRSSWIGFYAALDKPVYAKSPKEISGWLDGPLTHQGGYYYLQSEIEPASAPEGKHLAICGSFVRNPLDMKNKKWLAEKMDLFEREMDIMLPELKDSLWKSRHLVFDCSVFNKPGLVGTARPANKCPNVEGLYFGGDGFQGRGCGLDRTSRTSLTCVELILGERIEELKDTPHIIPSK